MIWSLPKSLKFPVLLFSCVVTFSCQDASVKLSGGYIYRDEGGKIKDILSSVRGGGEIPATVTAYVFDEDFILAKQRPKVSADPMYEKKPAYKYGPEHIYYWIIDLKQDTIWGPLSEDEYLSVRGLSGVPSELNLDAP